MNQPLVSILIPCYNAAPWLNATLESALAQTYPVREVIVVDDGSSDESPSIARRFESRGVRVFTQENAGQSAAFNRAISEARGDYFEFLDADDLLAPDKIERQIELAANLPADRILTGAWGRFVSDPSVADFVPNALWDPFLDPVEWLVHAWTNQLMMHGAAWLVPATVLRRAGGWNPELTLINDFEFFSRLLLHSDGAHFCPLARSYYRSNIPGSLSKSHSDLAWNSAFQATTLGTFALLAREDSSRTRAACAGAWRSYYYDCYPAVPHLRQIARERIAALGEPLGRGPGGPKFWLLARFIGWDRARRLQLATRQFRQRASASRNASRISLDV